MKRPILRAQDDEVAASTEAKLSTHNLCGILEPCEVRDVGDLRRLSLIGFAKFCINRNEMKETPTFIREISQELKVQTSRALISRDREDQGKWPLIELV